MAGAALPPDNFVSNGATAPSAACSAVGDLALAVRHFNLGAAPVLALSSRVLFFADYNFGRGEWVVVGWMMHVWMMHVRRPGPRDAADSRSARTGKLAPKRTQGFSNLA